MELQNVWLPPGRAAYQGSRAEGTAVLQMSLVQLGGPPAARVPARSGGERTAALGFRL